MTKISSKPALALSTIIYTLAMPASHAAETVNHQYDALGRLISSSKSGGPASGAQTTTAYDPAGNRSNQTVTGAGGGGGTPPPPPPPPPANNPPVANADNGGTMQKCSLKTVAVTGNDTDPNGDYPLTVVSASASGDMNASVANSTSVLIESGQTAGAKSISYTISDSRGATASGYISITVSNGVCQ